MDDETSSVHASQDESTTVLLIIDMLSGWSYPDADKVLAAARDIAPNIVKLKARCRQAGVPVIYANDNDGRWRSDCRTLMNDARSADGPGAQIAEQLAPSDDDYFVLKPMHSAFFATPLDLLLKHLKARRLILTGVTSDQCVLSTAMDAKMRCYDVCVPRDAVGTQTRQRGDAAIVYFEQVLCVDAPLAAEVDPG